MSDGDAGLVVNTKNIGAVRKDRLPVTEAMVGGVNCPGTTNIRSVPMKSRITLPLQQPLPALHKHRQQQYN